MIAVGALVRADVRPGAFGISGRPEPLHVLPALNSSNMPLPRWLTDSTCANKELVRTFRELAQDATEMGKVIGSRTAAARPWNAKGKVYTKAANALATLPDKITQQTLPQLEHLDGLDEDCYEKVQLYIRTGKLMTPEEDEDWCLQADISEMYDSR